METPPTPNYAAYFDRVLAVGALLVERLLDIPTIPDPDTERPRNPASDYQKITHAMRQTVLLLQADAREPRRIRARQQIIRGVEDAIHLHAAPRADRLIHELRERLADPAFDAEIDARATPDLIAELCHDLHAMPKFESHAHQRRTPADVAALAAQARTPIHPTPMPDEPPPIPTPKPPPPEPSVTARAPRRAPLSTPSLILPTRPEAHSRDHR